MTNKRTDETIERCLDMAMAALDQALGGILVTNERDMHLAQIEMIIFGLAGDMEIVEVIGELSTEAMKELLTPMVAAGERKLEELQAGPLLDFASRSVREIQRDVILAALAEWDRRRAAAKDALTIESV